MCALLFFGGLSNLIVSSRSSQEISMSFAQNVKTTVRQSDIHWLKGIVGKGPELDHCFFQIIWAIHWVWYPGLWQDWWTSYAEEWASEHLGLFLHFRCLGQRLWVLLLQSIERNNNLWFGFLQIFCLTDINMFLDVFLGPQRSGI